MHAMSVDVNRESALELPTVARGWPLPGAPRIDGDDERSDSESFPAQFMMGFAVIGTIAQDPIPIDTQSSIHKNRGELGAIVAGAAGYLSSHPQIALGVAEDRELRESESTAFGFGLLEPVMKADVAGFVPCGVESSFGSALNQAAAVGSLADAIQESIETPFFRIRW